MDPPIYGFLGLLKVIVDKENNDMPTDELDSAAIDWCISVGSNATKVSDILTGLDGNVMAAIQKGIDKANSRAISRAANVQKWEILPLDMSVATGELGPTLKLKRFFFNQKYTHNHSVEIGHTFIAKSAQKTYVNTQ